MTPELSELGSTTHPHTPDYHTGLTGSDYRAEVAGKLFHWKMHHVQGMIWHVPVGKGMIWELLTQSVCIILMICYP